jgi:multidrug efflux system membrane fusion protein
VTANEADDEIVQSTSDAHLVRGVRSFADEQTVFMDVRGETKANREVQVKAEVAGRIERLAGEKGSRVKKGDLLCALAVDARQNEYEQALAEVKSAQLEYDGFVDLNRKGLQSEVVLAKAKAALEQSRTRARRAELALAKTRIVAPFNGVVAAQSVEVGDYLTPGNTCVTVIELDPMLVSGQVAEKSVSQLAMGDAVKVDLITGAQLDGVVTYIGHRPDGATRTFPIEVTVNNPAADVRAGLTATMRVPVGNEAVHLISSASLVLNDSGEMGVRVVDEDSIVQFMSVQVVSESPEGVLVKGLPQDINLITVGHEEVSEGQQVRVDFTPVASLANN